MDKRNFPGLKDLAIEPEELPQSLRYIIDHCIWTQYSNKDLEKLYQLFINVESEMIGVGPLIQSFSSGHKFVTYINEKMERPTAKL